MKTRANENQQRHAAVRPDVIAGNQRLRTWLWEDIPGLEPYAIVWVAELGEGRYLRCYKDGRIHAYESPITPTEGTYGTCWRELK